MQIDTRRTWGYILSAVAGFAIAPGVVTAQQLDPSAIMSVSGPIRGLASFVLVALVGSLFLLKSEDLVDRSTDATMARPWVAVLYGLMAFVFVLFATFYADYLLGQLGLSGTRFGMITLVILGGGILGLVGFGYTIVGAVLTDLEGRRRPWLGVGVGAGISAVGWVSLSGLPAIAVWVLVAAVGIGGPMRRWVHSSRGVESELPT